MRSPFLAIVLVATGVLTVPAAIACGGGHHRGHQGGDANPNNGGDHNGGHHRGHHANPNHREGGWGDGHGGRHGRRDHSGGTDVEIGVSVPPTQRYGRGLMGPPTACQEIAALQADLGKLFELRVQINSGKRLIVVENGHQRVISNRGKRNALNAALTGGGTVGQTEYGWEQYDEMERDARELSLTIVDSRIQATQGRMAELEYSCQE